MMNSEAHYKVFEKKPLPELANPSPDGDGVFQHDLASFYTSKKLIKSLTDNNINTLAWPGNSRDINSL